MRVTTSEESNGGRKSTRLQRVSGGADGRSVNADSLGAPATAVYLPSPGDA